MSEQDRSSLAAIQARQAALATLHGAVADADRVLAEALADAHAVMREERRPARCDRRRDRPRGVGPGRPRRRYPDGRA